ncbi:MAG: hypothetical protein EBS70_06180 [Actinobacteria bacterium]|nr:hypothetical protein [Actinomycetota bacterium]
MTRPSDSGGGASCAALGRHLTTNLATPAECLLAPFVVGGSKSKAGGKYRQDNPPIDDGG